MKIIELDQDNDQEKWLNWRKGKLTASSVGPCVGEYKYKTPFMLYESLLGLAFPTPMNDQMLRGKTLEGPARKKVNEILGKEFKAVCCEHETKPYFAASLDGWVGDEILEIKCPNPDYRNHISKHFDSVESFKKAFPTYYLQISWQAMCMGPSIKTCYFATYWRDEIEILEIPIDRAYIAECEKKATIWYKKYIVGKTPPPLIRVKGCPYNKGDFAAIDDAGALALAKDLEEIKTSRKALADQDKPLKALEDEKKGLLTEYSEDDFYCKNIKAIKVRKAKLDIKQIAEDLGITEIELKIEYSSYSTYWKLTLE